jgi:hypothetical protein
MANDNRVVVSHELCGFQGRAGKCVVMMEQCGACSNSLLTSPGKLHNWSQWCLRAHALFSDGHRGWVLEFFQHFLSFCWCLVALYVHHLQPTLNQPWNMDAIQKNPVRLTECSPKASQSISRDSVADLKASRKTWSRHASQVCHP